MEGGREGCALVGGGRKRKDEKWTEKLLAEREPAAWPSAGAIQNPAAWRPVGVADCQQDLQLDYTCFVCSKLWSCKRSAVYALLSFGWRRFRVMEYLLS